MTLKGEVLQSFSVVDVTDDQIEAGIASLRGEIAQRPSAVSAVKIGGKRAYQLVREGREVELAERRVHIERFEGAGYAAGRRVRRPRRRSRLFLRHLYPALARDLGESLGVGGHLTALRRTRVGGYGLDHARSLDELAEHPLLSYSLDEACLLAFPRRDITEAEADDASHGRPLVAAGIEGVYAATDPEGRVIALLEDRGSRTKSVVVVRPATLTG